MYDQTAVLSCKIQLSRLLYLAFSQALCFSFPPCALPQCPRTVPFSEDALEQFFKSVEQKKKKSDGL